MADEPEEGPERTVDLHEEEVYPMNPESADDMTACHHMHEPGIMKNLEDRQHKLWEGPIDQGAVDVEQQVEVTDKRRSHRRLVPAERDVSVQHLRRSCGSKTLAVVQFDVEGVRPGGGQG